MKLIVKYISAIGVLLLLLGNFSSCTKMDDYLKYTDGKEILYIGKPEAMQMRSGRERVQFYGILIDPKITRLRITYNMGKDVIDLPVQRQEGAEVFTYDIPLKEGIYNFVVQTFDDEGHASVPESLIGSSYGSIYESTLYNRGISSVKCENNSTTISWSTADSHSPYVHIWYTDVNEQERMVQVEQSEQETVLEEYKSMSGFRMKTYYLPDTAAVDIFDIEANVEADETLTGTVMKNATEPFARQDEGTEKSGVLKDWEYTPNLLTQNGGRTGTFYEASAGKTFINMSTLNYDSAIENGKIWQKVTLPAGTYEFSFNVNTSKGNNLNPYGAVVVADVFPDTDQVAATALASVNWGRTTGTKTLSFTLDEETTLLLGWVASMGEKSADIRINAVALNKIHKINTIEKDVE